MGERRADDGRRAPQPDDNDDDDEKADAENERRESSRQRGREKDETAVLWPLKLTTTATCDAPRGERG